MALVILKRFVPVAASLVGLGLSSLALSGGCSGDGSTPPVMTEAQKEQLKKEEQAQADANNAAAKTTTQRRP